jgi:hypothetical protein
MDDPTLHSVLYNGFAFAVSAYPFGSRAGSGKYWSVRTSDGLWHVVCSRISDSRTDEERHRADVAIMAWLVDFSG